MSQVYFRNIYSATVKTMSVLPVLVRTCNAWQVLGLGT